jgi:hypothetical protein
MGGFPRFTVPNPNVKSDLGPRSEINRRLLERFLGGKLLGHSADQPPISLRPPADATLTGRRQFAQLRELSLEDYPQVTALQSRYGLGLKSYDEWSHIWVNNPVYLELRKNWPIGWVLENENKQIVGSHENIPVLYEFRKKRIVAATGRGMVVDSLYRGYALWLLMALFEQKTAQLCFDTTPNYETAQDDEALGALRVPVGAWDRHVFWITNYHGSLSIWLKRKMAKRIWPVVEPLSWALTPALVLKDTLARARLRRLSSGGALERCTTFDERFDAFWEDLRRENPDLLLAVRTREVLQWHFACALLQNRLWIWTINKDSRMAAYAIFLKTMNPASGITRVALVDFQSLGGNVAFLLPMLSAALETCRKDRVHLLENVGFSFENSGINNLAPYRSRGQWWTYFYKARDKDLAEILSNPRAWAPSLYDGDVSIS